MSTLSWKTIPTHDFLIVHGYIRDCCLNLSLDIPTDISNSIVVWYYDITTWKIKGEQLHKFLSLKNGESIYSNPFTIDKITFHCSLCPSGWKSNQKGFVQYYLEVKKLPKNMSSFTVYFEFYCYETRSSWKGIRTLTKANDAVGWFHYTLPLKQCHDTLNSLNLHHLTFGYCVEVLHMNYLIHCDASDDTNEHKSDKQQIQCIQPRTLTLNHHIQRTWILNHYPLQRFKHCVYPKNFHSPSFENEYWCLECQANFERNVMIYCRLKLIRMPFHIQEMKIKCKLQTNMKCDDGMNGKWERVVLSFKHNYTKWKAYLTDDRHNDSIRMSVEVQIVQLMDWNHAVIDASEWYKYGVVKNTVYKPLIMVQYAEDIEKNGTDQMLTQLECNNQQMIVKKEWIKPNFLNIPCN
eukprot:173258_1